MTVYSMLEDSLLSDRLVAGVRKMTLHNKLLQTADLTLMKCVDICEFSEFNSKQLKTKHDRSTTQEVDYIRAADSGRTPVHNAHTRTHVWLDPLLHWRGGADPTRRQPPTTSTSSVETVDTTMHVAHVPQ